MRIRKTTGVFLSGCCVYALVAACTGSVSVLGGSTGGQGGSPADSGLIDALTDPVPMADAAPMSGARLKKRYLLADDGTREDLPGWFDSQRQEQCTFLRAADGVTRCLPVSLDTADYADDKCTMVDNFYTLPNFVGCADPVPKYVARIVSSACPAAYQVFSLGPSMPTNASCRYYWSDGQCLSAGCTQPQVVTGYNLGPEIPPTEFVAAMVMTDP